MQQLTHDVDISDQTSSRKASGKSSLYPVANNCEVANSKYDLGLINKHEQ